MIKRILAILMAMILQFTACTMEGHDGMPQSSISSVPEETPSAPALSPAPTPEPSPAVANEKGNQMYIQIGDTVWTAILEDNPSVIALKERLANGPITAEMEDYGGFEKVGPLDDPLPQSNRQITTQPGDIILYQGSSITIYYGENTWNFTRLGRISFAGS